jgi:hypothetical protein
VTSRPVVVWVLVGARKFLAVVRNKYLQILEGRDGGGSGAYDGFNIVAIVDLDLEGIDLAGVAATVRWAESERAVGGGGGWLRPSSAAERAAAATTTPGSDGDHPLVGIYHMNTPHRTDNDGGSPVGAITANGVTGDGRCVLLRFAIAVLPPPTLRLATLPPPGHAAP